MNPVEDSIVVKRYDTNTSQYSDERFYTVFWMNEGIEAITIDHKHFLAQPNTIFFVARGSVAHLDFASTPRGWILQFADDLFREITGDLIIKDVDIFSAFGQVPRVILSPKIGRRVGEITEMIDELIGSQLPNRKTAIASLLRTLLIYCDSTCNVRLGDDANSAGVRIVTTYKELVSKHYREQHQVSEYARMMNITPSYLNEVTRTILGVTAKSIIQEQLTIHARRELKFSDESIKEIAFKLGFSDPFHFSNYFKKQVGCSPSAYRTR